MRKILGTSGDTAVTRRLTSDEQWLALVDLFGAATLDANAWEDALAALAAATGSVGAQLIGYGASGAGEFNWVVDPEPGWVAEITAAGGTDPSINPRLTAGVRLPVLHSLTDQEIISVAERRRNRVYADFFDRFDRPYICATNLLKEDGVSVGLAVLRRQCEGEITANQRAIFESVAPHARAAARARALLGNGGADLLAGAFDSLALTAFVCDRGGVVRAMTAQAEQLLSAGKVLRLRRGSLASRSLVETTALTAAIASAAGGQAVARPPSGGCVVLREELATPLVLDVLPLPRRGYVLGFEPRVLVVVRGLSSVPTRFERILRAAFQLTAAEADVAIRLAEGESIGDIAASREVFPSTVRSQLKTIYTKLGVHRQSELVARLNLLR